MLIVGWYLFARSGFQQVSLMRFIVEQSQPALNKQNVEESLLTLHDKLLTTKIHLSPVQLFHLRFNYYPASFYPLEILLKSNVTTMMMLIPLQDFPIPEKLTPSINSKKVEVEAEGRDGVVKLLRPRYFRKPLPRSVFSDY